MWLSRRPQPRLHWWMPLRLWLLQLLQLGRRLPACDAAGHHRSRDGQKMRSAGSIGRSNLQWLLMRTIPSVAG